MVESAFAFEELDRTLMLLSFRSSIEGAQILPLARFRINLARVQTVLT